MARVFVWTGSTLDIEHKYDSIYKQIEPQVHKQDEYTDPESVIPEVSDLRAQIDQKFARKIHIERADLPGGSVSQNRENESSKIPEEAVGSLMRRR